MFTQTTNLWNRNVLLAVALWLGTTGNDFAAQEPESLQPGLVAVYRSFADPSAKLSRIDVKPAFNLGQSSPHPRIPPGPFEVVWTGSIVVTDTGPISFSAGLCGDLTIVIDGVTVLAGKGERAAAQIDSGTPFDRPPGVYRLSIRFRSLSDLPARLQISWQSPAFSREPVPAWALKHAATDVSPTLKTEQTAEAGKVAVGQYGCARCHQSAFAGAPEPPPGPSLGDAGRRIGKVWLLDWLDDPAKVRADAHMPALFTSDRVGFVERWLIAEHLVGSNHARNDKSVDLKSVGDHRPGRVQFISAGCAACHFMPDLDRAEQLDLGRTPLTGFTERLPATELAAFLGNPLSRYPDGRMPRLPLAPEAARNIAAYLLLWSKPAPARENLAPPTADEIQAVSRRLKASGAVGEALIRAKRCTECHSGLGNSVPADVPIADDTRGCLSGKTLPRFTVSESPKVAIGAYRAMAARDKHGSPFVERQRQLERAGCVRCHQRDSDRPSPLEATAVTLGGSGLETVPFQRAPRLTNPHRKFTQTHLLAAVREGVKGLRAPRYTYVMPAYGDHAAELERALAEADGELVDSPEPASLSPTDPTLGSLAGPMLVGSQGYACVSCHVWQGKMLADQDPASTGPDLTRVNGRIRRDWFDRYLESPTRAHPGTPMPMIFPKGQPASLSSVLDGNAAKQKDALWAYFAMGKQAPSPKPPPPLPITASKDGPLIAQMPVRLPNGKTIESITVLYANGDLFVYDLGAGSLHSAYVGAQVLRSVQGRLRTNSITGTLVTEFTAEPLQLLGSGKPESSVAATFLGYDREDHGVRIRRRIEFTAGVVEMIETLSVRPDRTLVQESRFSGIPKDRTITATRSTTHPMPAAIAPPAPVRVTGADPGPVGGSLVRPGYRAIAYLRPKTVNGDDLVMPGALAVNPKDGRVFVASLKSGAIYVLRDPNGDGRDARFDDYAGGVFQDTLAMMAEPAALYVMHRRNLTRITDGPDGRAKSFDRVAALTQDVTDSYDYGYGLVRDRTGAFVYSYAPYANTKLSGAGGALRLNPGKPTEEVAYGFRNPLGWCTGTDGEIFFTDNQGEWIATSKFAHLAPGRFYGFPNPQQRQHASKPPGNAAVWVPYGWAHSINGVTCDTTAGKFGPFAGQFFLAELVFGGAIIRADLEKVNGEYQGACFPFWGNGLLGPLTLAFDPKGRLFVGGITEPGWMAQPDRGAVFRIDYTGELPFEMKSIRILPQGFRVIFTRPATAQTAGDLKSYKIESHRYEYTGAYGSPELDRATVAVTKVEVAANGLSADLTTSPLVKDRVYVIQTRGVRSSAGEPLVHPMGAYTLNELPVGK